MSTKKLTPRSVSNMPRLGESAIYNPCTDKECIWKQQQGRCPQGDKNICPLYVFGLYVRLTEYERGDPRRAPDEVLMKLLQMNGWHGELRHDDKDII